MWEYSKIFWGSNSSNINQSHSSPHRSVLLCMKDKGIPVQMIRWLRSFLNDRRARVCLNGHLSKSYIFKQGLPQGSVLAPLLFLFHINDLAESPPEDVIAALFEDDVTILSTAPPPSKGSKESPFSEAQRMLILSTNGLWSGDFI